MKYLIYGHRGWIGQQVVDYLEKNRKEIKLVMASARLENYQQLQTEVAQVSNNFKEKIRILSFTGRTHGGNFTTIDYLEQPGNLTINLRDNLYGPLNLAILSKEHSDVLHYTYLGTGCIFKYDKDHPLDDEQNGFTDNDLPNFYGSGYSTVKGFTDQLMHRFEDSVLNLRIRMPITSHSNPRNFISKITNYEKVVNIPNSMTVLPDLIPIMIQMIQIETKGTFNFTNPGTMSHNEILDQYQELHDPNFTYQNFTEEQQNAILAAERSNNYLDTTKLEKYCQSHGLKLLPLGQSIKKILTNFK